MKNRINYNTKKRFINIASIFLAFALFIGMMPADVFDASAASPSVYYRVHQQNYGTLGYVKNGQSAGYTGKSLRIESMSAYISGMSGNILYKTHQQNVGWSANWSSNGSTSGREGQSLQLEAIQVKLTGEISKYYDVHYRVHMKGKSWGPWVKNGSTAGTVGEGRRLESIEIKLVAKSTASSSSSTASNTSTSSLTPANLSSGFYKVLTPGTVFSWNIQFAPSSGNGNAVLDTFNSEGNEIFYIESLGSNKYYIRPYYRYSEGDFAINSLYGASTKENQQLIAHDATNRNDTASQWYIYKSGNYYVFRNVASGKYVTLAGAAKTGTKLTLTSSGNSMSRMFTVTRVNVPAPANSTTFTISTSTSSTRSNVWPVGGNGGTHLKNWPKYSSGSYHSGTDISGTIGTPIYSTHAGTVYRVRSLTTSYGKHVIVKCNVGGKTVYIYYCHLNSINVSEGQTVKAGTQLGTLGNTGNSSGPHLHYEVRNSNLSYGSLNNPTLNPYDYLPSR